MSNTDVIPSMIPLTGAQLEHVAAMYGIPRAEGESIDSLHQRVIATIETAKRSDNFGNPITPEMTKREAVRRAILLGKLNEAGQMLSMVAEAQQSSEVKSKMETLCGAIVEAHELLSPVHLKVGSDAKN